MKKLFAVIAVITLFAVVFSGCGKTEATKQVQELISAIGETTVDSSDAISAAREAYDSLSVSEKEKVRNYEKLEKAEAEYKEIVDFNTEINTVITSASSKFSESGFNIDELLKKAEAIKTAYEEMSEKRKAQVVDYDKLDGAVEKLNSYTENAQIAAAEYIKAFNSVYAKENYIVTGIYCIKQIRNETDEYHLFALKYKNAAGEEKTVYSQARCTAEVTAEAIAARPGTFFSESPVTENTDAVLYGNVELSLEAVLGLINS